jgi:hypothetical protein
MSKYKPLYAVLGKYNGRITYRFPFIAAEDEVEAKDMAKNYLISNASDKDMAMIDNTEFFAAKRLKDGIAMVVLV